MSFCITSFDAVPVPGQILFVIRAGPRAVLVRRLRMGGKNREVALRFRVRRGITPPTGGGSPLVPSLHDPLGSPPLHTVAPYDVGSPFVDAGDPGFDLSGDGGTIGVVVPNVGPSLGEFPYVIRPNGWLSVTAENTVGEVRLEIETAEPARERSTASALTPAQKGVIHAGPGTLHYLQAKYIITGPASAHFQMHDVDDEDNIATATIVPIGIFPIGVSLPDVEYSSRRGVQFAKGIGWAISATRLTYTASAGTAAVGADWDRR